MLFRSPRLRLIVMLTLFPSVALTVESHKVYIVEPSGDPYRVIWVTSRVDGRTVSLKKRRRRSNVKSRSNSLRTGGVVSNVYQFLATHHELTPFSKGSSILPSMSAIASGSRVNRLVAGFRAIPNLFISFRSSLAI